MRGCLGKEEKVQFGLTLGRIVLLGTPLAITVLLFSTRPLTTTWRGNSCP